MKITVSSKNFEVTESIRQHVQAQASKVYRLSDKVAQLKVFLESVARKHNDPHANSATVVVEVPGKDTAVTKSAVDMYEAINQAFGSASRHLRKTIEKLQTKKVQARK